MASGPEHYLESERLLALLTSLGPNSYAEQAPLLIAQAQVHAQLAHAAATALTNGRSTWGPDRLDEWVEVTT